MMASNKNLTEIQNLIDKVCDLDDFQKQLMRQAEDLHEQYLRAGADAAEYRARLYQLGVTIK